jgi:hypothetical protein
MAALAFRGSVFATKYVLGIRVVIEVRLPGDDAVAVFTAIAKGPFMFVVLAVAAHARRRSAFVLSRRVTGCAFDL